MPSQPTGCLLPNGPACSPTDPMKESEMKLRNAMFIALGRSIMAPLYAADMKDVMEDRAEARNDAAKDQAERNYDVAKDNCKKMTGNAKAVCMKDSTAAYVGAKAQAKANEKAPKSQAVV